MNYYDVIFAQQKAKKDSKYFGEISDAINVLAGTETTYTPSEMASAILDAIPTETASGNPIHITDAAAYPAESVVTTLEPVQDLHGYSKPWPAGGGKNLFNPDAFVQGLLNHTTGDVESANIWITSDFVSCQKTVTIQGWKDGSESNFCVRFCEYDTDRNFIKNTSNINVSDVATYSRSITLDNNTRYVRASFGFNNKQTSVSAFFDTNRIQLELDSTASTFEPYSNECPISGHTGVELTRTGKNLLNQNNIEAGYYDSFDFIPAVQDSLIYKSYNLFLKSGTYTISFGVAVGIIRTLLNGKVTMNPASDVTSYTFTVNTDSYVGISWRRNDNTNWDSSTNIQLEFGDTATTYEPYTPETHSMTFPQAQSPVYGCEVDWTNGVLRVDKLIKQYTSIVSIGTEGNTKFWIVDRAMDSINTTNTNTDLYVSNTFVSKHVVSPGNFYITNDGQVLVVIPYEAQQSITSVTDANAWLTSNPLQVVYPLATPLEIPLTPEVITLLKGENNIWTDAGSSEIGYKVDLQSYIQKLIDEASTSASALSVSPLSLGKSAAVSTDSEDGGEIEDLDEPAEESEEAEDLTAKKEITEELAETEKVEDIKETKERESEVEE